MARRLPAYWHARPIRRHRTDRRFTTTQGILLALCLSLPFWALVGLVAWLIVR